MVLIMPVEMVTLRIRLLAFSATYIFPAESAAIAYGPNKLADVAAPPSPRKLLAPLPAIVEMTPVDMVILRIRLFLLSAMYTLPVEIE